MAKQSGLHQLRGKVGEHSYYRQTGIESGLVRAINQGMSARVKNDEAFANTRLNNAEFGAAASIAGLLGKMVVPKYRPMILPFSQSKMAKDILEIARQSGGSWGQRVVTGASTDLLCETLTKTSKLAMTDYVKLILERASDTSLDVTVEWTAEQASVFADLGISGLSVSVAVYDLATGKYVASEGGIHKSYSRLRANDSGDSSITVGAGGDYNTTVEIPANFTPTPELYNGHRIVVVVLMPYRTINSVQHVLQQYCCFVAADLPADE